MNKSFIKSVSILASGNILSQLINLIALPFVSRLYDKSDFGEYALFVTIGTVLITFFTLGLNAALMSTKDDHETKQLFSVNFIIIIVLAIIVFTILFIISPWVKIFNLSGNYILLCFSLFIYTISNALSNMLTFFYNKKGNDKILFSNYIIISITNLLILIPLGFYKFGIWGFVFSGIISCLLRDIYMLKKSWPFISVNWSDFRYVIINYKDYIKFQLPSNFVGSFNNQIQFSFLSKLFGNSSLGLFSMTDKILNVPARLLATPISNIYFRYISNLPDKHNDFGFTYKFSTYILILSIPFIAFIKFFGESLMTLFLGDEWASIGIYMSVLCIQYILSFCSNCICYCRIALNRQKADFLFEVMRFIFIITPFIISRYYNLSILYTITLLSVMLSIYYIIDIFMNIRIIGTKRQAYTFASLSIIYALIGYFCMLFF